MRSAGLVQEASLELFHLHRRRSSDVTRNTAVPSGLRLRESPPPFGLLFRGAGPADRRRRRSAPRRPGAVAAPPAAGRAPPGHSGRKRRRAAGLGGARLGLPADNGGGGGSDPSPAGRHPPLPPLSSLPPRRPRAAGLQLSASAPTSAAGGGGGGGRAGPRTAPRLRPGGGGDSSSAMFQAPAPSPAARRSPPQAPPLPFPFPRPPPPVGPASAFVPTGQRLRSPPPRRPSPLRSARCLSPLCRGAAWGRRRDAARPASLWRGGGGGGAEGWADPVAAPPLRRRRALPQPLPAGPSPRRAPRDALRGGPASGAGRVSASGRGGVGWCWADWKPPWGGCAACLRGVKGRRDGGGPVGLGVAGSELASPERWPSVPGDGAPGTERALRRERGPLSRVGGGSGASRSWQRVAVPCQPGAVGEGGMLRQCF